MSKLKVDELRSADRSVSDSANITLADDGSDNGVIEGMTVTGGNIASKIVTVNGTANVTLASSSDNNAGAIKINSTSDYSYISGDFTVNRYYNGTSDGWRMVAAPIKSATLAD